MIMWNAGKPIQNDGKFAKNIGNFLDKKKLNKNNNDHVRYQ